ncbi:HEAT repeat domain-containing protein [Sphingomonas guangdongensis]|uniref:HEAT repeat domain-containing protein n=1 Tax=Sphingomonas guangdongensis TaxID=1141890 RepID=UPI0015C863AF|nr:HEAT repeat domain-containing protein [Sphingomonas guangdongensis]
MFQMLRSLQLGMALSASFAFEDGEASAMTITLEPDDSGDLRIDEGGVSTIEQVKLRALHRRWTTGTLAGEVLPDLIRGARPDEPQRFRFASNHLRGLADFQAYLAGRADRDSGKSFAWGKALLSSEDFAARIADRAGCEPSDARLRHVLDNLSLVSIDVYNAARAIEERLTPLLDAGEDVEEKRHALMGRLFQAASAGESLGAAELLRLVGPDAMRRLRHAGTAIELSAAASARDCRALGYEAQAQARLHPIAAASWFTVLSGESGQGKTWSLCQSALSEARNGAVVVVGSPGSLEAIFDAINSRLWLPAYESEASLEVLSRRLGRFLAPEGGHWLTLYVDDVQDRLVARRVAETDWRRLGVKVVLSCQPRVTMEIVRWCPDAHITQVADFTSAELRRYLRHHDRHDSLEMMPDDVFELLRKPVHARVYVGLPSRGEWLDATEYELFKSYWDEATADAREQYDHPYDRHRLANLAGTLLKDHARYPWTWSDLEMEGLDEAAIRRLEMVGLLRRPARDRIAFSTDRMLNWAVSEHLSERVASGALDAASLNQVVQSLDDLVDAAGAGLGRRLGYVFHDVVWLLLRVVDAAFVADLIDAYVAQAPHEWRSDGRWRQLGTVGPMLLPSLERLALRTCSDEQDVGIADHLPAAIVAAGAGAPDEVSGLVARLLDMAGDRETRIALRVARRVPLPRVLDRLFDIHLRRAADLDLSTEVDERSTGLSRYSLSMEALKRAVGASPAWLEARLAVESRVQALDQLVWCLVDDAYLTGVEAKPIWARQQDQVVSVLPRDSKALIAALEHFDAVDRREYLDAVPSARDDWMPSRILRVRARIDPEAAFEQIRTSADDYGWSASDWWLPELHRYDADRLSTVLREVAARTRSPGNELMLYYFNHPELVDPATLEIVIDDCLVRVRNANRSRLPEDRRPDSPVRAIRFLGLLPEPWQFEQLRRRADSSFERELTRYAIERRGRTTRLRDLEGNECERVLAMVDGSGFAELVVAELERGDGFGREDGYNAAHWTENGGVRTALINATSDDGSDGYRQVIRMQALAIHACDASLERMLRLGSPVYVSPAEMRSSEGRDLSGLRQRVVDLLSSGDPADLDAAVALAGFLREPEDALPLLEPFLDDQTPAKTRRSVVGTMKALGFYDASMLPVIRAMLVGHHDDQAWFLTSYLAEFGDEPARELVRSWLDGSDTTSISTARLPTLHALRSHEDSREAVLGFVRRLSERGHRLLDSHDLGTLARAGDERAREMLVNAAYRGPEILDAGPVGGILFLLEIDPEEAFFAATRLLVRHRSPEAVRLMFRIDKGRAYEDLLSRYRSLPPSLRNEVGRNVRAHVPAAVIEASLARLAASTSTSERRTAAELSGWMPPSMSLPWLRDLIGDADVTVRKAVLGSLRARRMEDAALAHLGAMPTSTKSLQWARLRTVFELVDPRFLWTRGDELSLQPFLEDAAYEFWVEARQLHEKREKEVADNEKKADAKAD